MKQILITFNKIYDIDGNTLVRDIGSILSSSYTKVDPVQGGPLVLDPAEEGITWLDLDIKDRAVAFDPMLSGVGDVRPILNPASGWRIQGDCDITANEIRFQAVSRDKVDALVACLKSDLVQWAAGNITEWPAEGKDEFLGYIVNALSQL